MNISKQVIRKLNEMPENEIEIIKKYTCRICMPCSSCKHFEDNSCMTRQIVKEINESRCKL